METFVELLPVEVLKGSIDSTRRVLTLNHPGGVLPDGKRMVIWENAPSFTTGDTALVLLTPYKDDYFITVSGELGKYGVSGGRFDSNELAGLDVSHGLNCVQDMIRLRSPGRLASQADLACIADVTSRKVVVDSTGQESTVTKVKVVETIRGRASDSEVLVVQQGDITNRVHWPYDQPRLAIGERYVLFLSAIQGPRFAVIGGFGGSYQVRDEKIVKHGFALRQLVREINADE